MVDIGLFLRDVGNVLMPRYCGVCGRRLRARERAVCNKCLAELPLTQFKGKRNTPIDRLFYSQRSFVRGTAYMFYTPHASMSRPVRELKYADRREVGLFFGERMARDLEGSDFFDGADCLVPVPLARARLRERGYNQAEILARGIARATGLRVRNDLLKRVVNNPTQTHLSQAERRTNVEGIFKVPHPERLEGLHVVLVDDVVTTGATVTECIRTLEESCGTMRVSVAALCVATSFCELPGFMYNLEL